MNQSEADDGEIAPDRFQLKFMIKIVNLILKVFVFNN